MKTQINIRFLLLILITAIAGTARLVMTKAGDSAWMNFTPVGAMALFGGAYFSGKWKPFAFPLLTLFLSDIALIRIFYPSHVEGLLYTGWYWTYGAFAAMALIGKLVLKKVNAARFLAAGFFAALAHYIIADFGMWLESPLYSKDLAGFIACYVVAIPYFKNMLLGNFFFGAALFGGFELAQWKIPALRPEEATVSQKNGR